MPLPTPPLPQPAQDPLGDRSDGLGEGAGVARKISVLVACEYSATVRDAFLARGFDAWSCDLLPTEGDTRRHLRGDALAEIAAGPPGRGELRKGWPLTDERGSHYQPAAWDLLICHPPCTHLAVSGARHFEAKRADGRQQDALAFVQALLDAPVAHIALENPVSIISSHIRKPDQTIQPWQFGHGETKATCLWLKNLPLLVPTHIEGGDLFTAAAPAERDPRVWRMPSGPDRWKERSRTYAGIAAAMAQQWGDYLLGLTPSPPLGGEAREPETRVATDRARSLAPLTHARAGLGSFVDGDVTVSDVAVRHVASAREAR